MRVLMLGPCPTIRGPLPKIVPLLVSSLERLGCDVVNLEWGRRDEHESIMTKLTGRAQDIRVVRQLLRQQSVDVMIVQTTHQDWFALARDIPLLAFTRSLCPRIVLQLHGSQSDELVSSGHVMLKVASRLLLRLSDAILVLSTHERRQWQEFYPKCNVHVVSNPYAPPPTSGCVAPRAYRERPGKRLRVLYVGRLVPEKGILDLLEAAAKLRRNVAFDLMIVGEGPALPIMRERIGTLGLISDVSLTGYLVGQELQSAYADSDVFVLPSWSEGFPTVISEAMNYGLPIVTTNIKGIVDHLQEGVHALFVPEQRPDLLGSAIERLLRDPAMRDQMGAANREKVTEFAPDRVAARYLAILNEIAQTQS
jgi:glycosyltransferase involved in cell wall biosynthesis